MGLKLLLASPPCVRLDTYWLTEPSFVRREFWERASSAEGRNQSSCTKVISSFRIGLSFLFQSGMRTSRAAGFRPW